MSFLIKNYELLEKYNNIWDKISNCIKKDLAADQCITKISEN